MIVAPAVDLRGGRCVQLVGGMPENERVSLPDPVAVARAWRAQGFSTLHVVDLDAALGSGDNLPLIRGIIEGVTRPGVRDGSAAGVADGAAAGGLARAAVRGSRSHAAGVDIQVGGGIRSDERADALLEGGARRVIIGTRALDEPEWLARIARRRPGAVMIALDTRDGVILRKGWTEATGLRVEDYLPGLSGLPLAGVLSTDVGREGRLAGIDRQSCARVVESSPHPVWISGGVTTMDDLRFLDGAGAAGVVLGMAVYTGTLDTEALAERWGGHPREQGA